MAIENVGQDLNSLLFEGRKAAADEGYQKVVEKKSQKKDNKENTIQTNDTFVSSKKEQPVEKAEKEVKAELKTKPASEVVTGGSKEVNNGVDTFSKSVDAANAKKPETAPTTNSTQDDEESNPQIDNSLGNLQNLLANYAPQEAAGNPEAK